MSLLDFIRRRVGVGELVHQRVDWIPIYQTWIINKTECSLLVFLKIQVEACFLISRAEKNHWFSILNKIIQEKSRFNPNLAFIWTWILMNPGKNQVKKRLDFWYFFLYLFPGIFLTFKLHRVEMQNYSQENTPFKAWSFPKDPLSQFSRTFLWLRICKCDF